MTKRRLGKGLGALIPDLSSEGENSNEAGRLLEVPLEKIRPNPRQPRRVFDEQKLREMAGTIQKYGIIQPILVVERDGAYQIVAGERRFRAAQLAGLKTIPAEIRDYNSDQYMEIALIENLQREDLNPIEEAVAYQRLIEEFKLTQEEVAQRLGRSRSSIANSLRLLSLPDEIKRELVAGKLTTGQVRPLLALKDESEQKDYAAKIISEKLTARQVEKYVQEKREAASQKTKVAKQTPPDDAEFAIIKEIEDKLRKVFGTKVLIKPGKKEGKVEFTFYNKDDLNRLLQLLLKQ